MKRFVNCSNCPYEWDCTERTEVNKQASSCSEYDFRKEQELDEYIASTITKKDIKEFEIMMNKQKKGA